jgi:fumarylpyruvate hydrolase
MSQVMFPVVPVTIAVAGQNARWPVRRIFCVGRNYAAHVREMGGDPQRTPPVFFTKPADAVLADGAEFPYPPRSENLQPEVELVVAIGRGGANIAVGDALDHVAGYAVGNDWTRRDLQASAKRGGEPWDMAKAFDHSASLGPIHLVADVGHPRSGKIQLSVNAQVRQSGDLSAMIANVSQLIAELSTYVCLQPGDLMYTGTPDGVSAVVPGDRVVCVIEGLGSLVNTVVERL